MAIILGETPSTFSGVGFHEQGIPSLLILRNKYTCLLAPPATGLVTIRCVDSFCKVESNRIIPFSSALNLRLGVGDILDTNYSSSSNTKPSHLYRVTQIQVLSINMLLDMVRKGDSKRLVSFVPNSAQGLTVQRILLDLSEKQEGDFPEVRMITAMSMELNSAVFLEDSCVYFPSDFLLPKKYDMNFGRVVGSIRFFHKLNYWTTNKSRLL